VSKNHQSRAQQMGASNGTHTGGVAPRPRETFEGSHGTLFPPTVVTRNKQSDCPQNPAHLRGPSPGTLVPFSTRCLHTLFL